MRGSRAADLTLCVVRLATQPSMHVLVPRVCNPTLTDAQTFLYHCLPNHRSALAKGVGGDPPFQGDQASGSYN